MPRTSHKRRIKLIRPRLQLKLIGWFAGVACLALLLQYLLLGWLLNDLATRLPADGAIVAAAAGELLLQALGLSLLFLLPVTLAIGVLVTFRVAGPVHRFETYLAQVARGEDPGRCRIRSGDELQELCLHINMAVDTLRSAGASPPAAEPEAASVDAAR